MGSRKFDPLRLEEVMEENKLIAGDAEAEAKAPTVREVTDDDYIDEGFPVYASAVEAVEKYLEENSTIYPKLQRCRARASELIHRLGNRREDRKGDEHPTEQLRDAEQDAEMARRLNKKMGRIAQGIQTKTMAFITDAETERPRILDLCTSHGPFLAFALEINPAAHAVSFNLPLDQGGLPPLVKGSETVDVHTRDINTLIADMGLRKYEIPQRHPYLKMSDHTHLFNKGLKFDLVLCDGPFLRTQETYRQGRQSRRLLLTQLALGLENCRVGGMMIVMLRRLEWLETIKLWLDFKGFANVDFYKSRGADAEKAYFYLVATDIKDTSNEAMRAAAEAVKEWKREWKVATLGTAKQWRQEKNRLAGFGELGVDGVLEQYGPELVQLGRYIWKREVDGLKKATRTNS